jgi:FkbH-like protein
MEFRMPPLRQDVPPTISVSATFTAELIEAPLRFWIAELGWDYRVLFAPYNQVFQQLLDPESLLARNRDGVNLVLVRFEDWWRFGRGGAEVLEANAGQLIAALRQAAASLHSPTLVTVCPASPELLADAGAAALTSRLEAGIANAAGELAGMYWMAASELAELYPSPNYYDPHADQLGHIPYTPAFFAALGALAARKIHALRRPPFKAIVLDCDETLWSGVCGEDGPEGVTLDPPRRFLQEFMRRQRDSGLLLCLASKNNDEDVVETFRVHPEMPLRLEDFVTRRIGWEPKSKYVAAMAEELNLGLDSFIFVDDNPTECAELEAHCPEALALPLPAEPERIPTFLRHVWAFDRLRATREDRERSTLYAQEIERGRLEKKSASFEEFLRALDLDVRIAPVRPGQLPRVAQLTQRTNQMNFTCVRRSEAQLHALLAEGRAECLAVEVSDRFGSYGLVGAMIFETRGEALALDTFLLSCRALGRGVEHRMLAALGAMARERGLAYVEALFTTAPRNKPALKLLESVAGEPGPVFRLPAQQLAGLEYRPNGVRPAAAPAPPRAGAPSQNESVDYVRIATDLSTVDALLERQAAQTAPRPASSTPFVAPRTALEKQLAAIWAELLGAPAVGVNDNFFDLGGHSLLAVQLLSRVREICHTELSLEVVYGGPFTVAELAKAIDVQEIAHAGGDYSAMLEEVENLSDEEVRALLAQEDQPSACDPPR